MTRKNRYHVLIAGGGVAALEAMVALRQIAEDRVDLTLLAPDKQFTYRPLAVAAPFGLGSLVRFPLEELTTRCGARYEQGAVTLVSAEAQSVYTSRGRSLDYEALLVATGAQIRDSIPGAITFGGPRDSRVIEMLFEDVAWGLVHRIVLAVPTGVGWTLPLYELALLIADRLAREELAAEITFVTPEEQPLAVFGSEASESVQDLFSECGIELRTQTHPVSFEGQTLALVGDAPIETDWVLTLPRLVGRTIDGLPQVQDDFIPTDEYGRVTGVGDVYAAGDGTSFPLKQGGIAAQQADAAAETIAAAAGVPITPKPFEPVLRGLLLTGRRPAFLRAQLEGGRGSSSIASPEPLWWPAGKIAARYLGPYLAEYMAAGARYEPSRLLV
jgi:sulfide:quinone oxidoreductase